MRALLRLALAGAGLAAILIPLHLLRFGLPAPDPRLLWMISQRPLYHQETRNGKTWEIPNSKVILVDAAHQKKFPAAKPPGTYRIFCIGQSTTEGYPFYPRAGYPEWLGLILKDTLPGRRVEVINSGVSGSDSSRDLALVKEVLNYHPDLLVLYEGNNEQLYSRLRLLQNHLGKNFGEFLFWLRDYFPIVRLAAQYMPIARVDPEATMPLYEQNVRKMVSLAERRSVHVVLVSQVNAPILYNPASPPPYNKFLRSILSPGVLFVDAGRFFSASGECRPDIPRCLIDYVHPSLRGQWLMAMAVAHGLSHRGWIAPVSQWRWRRVRTESAYSKTLGLTGHFLAKAFVREAEGLGEDSGKLGDLSYYVSTGEHFEQGVFLRALADEPIQLRSSDLEKAVLSYYDRTYPGKKAEFKKLLTPF